MKVLILDNSVKVTGAFKSILGVANTAAKVEFTFLTPSRSNLDILTRAGHFSMLMNFVEIQRNWRVLFYMPRLILNTIKTLSVIRKLNIEIVHVNDLYNMIGILVKIVRPKTNLVYHIRLLPNSYAKKLYPFWAKLIFKYADQIICVSQSVADLLPSSPSKTVIHDGMACVSIDEVDKADDFFWFLFPANYIEGKGQLSALRSFREIAKTKSNWRLKFVGDDMGLPKNIEFRRKLESLCGAWNLNGLVQFEPFVEDMLQEMFNSDVILMFSESESFSMICLESAIAGKPVIATKCGGPEEVVEHLKTGILVEVGNVLEMIESMKMLMSDADLRERLGRDARARGEHQFSIEKSAQKLIDGYKSIVQRESTKTL